MQPHGNHIKVGHVLIAIATTILFLCMETGCVDLTKTDETRLYDGDIYGGPVENIGPQRSVQRDSLFRQLDKQVGSFLNPPDIE